MTPEQELITIISKLFTDEIARMENQMDLDSYVRGFIRGAMLAKKLYKEYDKRGNNNETLCN